MLANIVTDLTNKLDEFSSNWWFLLVIFAIALLDSVIPVVPSETTVIIGGVAAGQGNQNIALVIFAGAFGAFLGDNLAYTIGDKFKGTVQRWAARKPSRQIRLDSAGRQIRKRGGMLLITARFIPGGRTILTVSSGVTSQPRGWFVAWIALATTVWASYAGLLGYLFGQTFENNHTLAFWLAFATALGITGLIELVRWLRERRNHAAA
jgi:membrane protein DedA with SNARE-associated domain|tara:strand:+ start:3052 stop:3675 length:624 start_codon:yes stop_codon:yes gene_type:complete